MPKRPAAKLMPRRKIVKVKSETGSGAKLPGKNRFKNQETEGEVGRGQESCKGRTCSAGTSF